MVCCNRGDGMMRGNAEDAIDRRGGVGGQSSARVDMPRLPTTRVWASQHWYFVVTLLLVFFFLVL